MLIASAPFHLARDTNVALNTMRGLLREFGIFIPVGAEHVVPRVRELLVEDQLPVALRTTLATTCNEIEGLKPPCVPSNPN